MILLPLKELPHRLLHPHMCILVHPKGVRQCSPTSSHTPSSRAATVPASTVLSFGAFPSGRRTAPRLRSAFFGASGLGIRLLIRGLGFIGLGFPDSRVQLWDVALRCVAGASASFERA